MNIVIPMAGEGKRFKDNGYEISKPIIPTFSRLTGDLIPMVVCATQDLPYVAAMGENVIYIDRDFHKNNGDEAVIRKYYPHASFITIDNLTEGQACTCLLAKDYINNEEELLIAGCDNGMVYSLSKFEECKKATDLIVFSYRNNEAVLDNPSAYGWMIVDDNDNIVGTSIKKPISDNPLNDHAVVATFWFRKGSIFVEAANRMIEHNDRIKNEFYVDQVVKHAIELGYKAKVFEIDRYIGWGTPKDYEIYQKTFKYWNDFYKRQDLIED